MKIGLIDVDGHNFPNLALMRISAYHKQQGNSVEWYFGLGNHYDIVYMSKVFSEEYSADADEPVNADKVVRGGTGYAIRLDGDREKYSKNDDPDLPASVEAMCPDYTIYPQYKYAISQTSRGCPRGCPFCHVAAKEGRVSRRVADVQDFWRGQKEIKILDPNITACREREDLLQQYARTGAWCDFTQGVDARLLDLDTVELLNRIKIKRIHFAWDMMDDVDSVLKGLEMYRCRGAIQDYRRRTVYVLTNFGTTQEEDLYRIKTIERLGYTPFVMVYNKNHAPSETIKLQRWCNNSIIFRSCPDFRDYDGKR